MWPLFYRGWGGYLPALFQEYRGRIGRGNLAGNQSMKGIIPMCTNATGAHDFIPDSEYLSLEEARLWILKTYNLKVCFRTIYYWVHRGRFCRSGRRMFLKTERWRHTRTTKRWIIHFIEAMI